MLQPFTGDMMVVSPLYRFVSGALYWVSYLNTRVHITGMAYVVAISLASLVYVIIGYWLINKKAPETFRIRM